MKISTKITIGLAIAVAIVFLLSLKFDELQTDFFFTTFLVVGSYVVLWLSIALRPNHEKEVEDLLRAKRQFRYCYQKINEQLNAMHNGITIQWREGEGTSAWSRWFSDFSGKKSLYRAFKGILSDKGMEVIVFYDVDDENILGYIPFPVGHLTIDPFEIWNPFDKSNANFVNNRHYKQGNQPASLSLSLNNSPSRAQAMPNFTPSEDAVDEAYNRMRRNGGG